MATGGSLSIATPSIALTDEQRRWMVTGICLNKLLTPVLRTVLKKEISDWYHNILCNPPHQINKQTHKKHEKKLPSCKGSLNYGNVNNNNGNHKSKTSAYDYDIKSPESLAKLFVQPFMAKFIGFDSTMDLSAVLTVMCEADPFHTSGAAAQAQIVRSVVRNEWAHCNFSHWDDGNYLSSLQEIESLVKKLKLPSSDESDLLTELENWKDKGKQQNTDINLEEIKNKKRKVNASSS